MNKNEQEKKLYIAPAMEVLSFQHGASLLLDASQEDPSEALVDFDDQ